MAKTWICDCGRRNSADRDTCVDCERARPDQPERRVKAKVMRRCEVDDGTIDERGYCSSANAFVSWAWCPFVCPLCRHPLTWDGVCFACFGCSTGKREDWTIPGDRYETQKGHWYMVEQGPFRVCTPEQNAEAVKIVMAVLEGKLTVEQGQEMIELVVQ